MRRFVYFFCALICTFLMIVLHLRLYYSIPVQQPPADGLAQLNHLEKKLHGGADSAMQKLFPEGLLFTNALYGLTWIEHARENPSLQRRAIREASRALQRMESPTGKAPFDPQLTPPYGVFYAGWTTWLRGNVLALQQPNNRDTAEVRYFTVQCSTLAEAFTKSATPFLPSYSQKAWPADNLVAMAALQVHDRLFTPKYAELIALWLHRVHERLDTTTGLIPHAVDNVTGFATEGARGSSQSLMLRFLPVIDTGFA